MDISKYMNVKKKDKFALDSERSDGKTQTTAF